MFSRCISDLAFLPNLQAFAGLIDSGRLETKNTDVEPYMVDGTTHLSQLNHGIRTFYYAAPTYGDQADPNLAKFAKFIKPTRA